ncbi:MAG: four helix bundle protein [Candidatus Margulisiibacteriota bacterium]
MSEQIENLESKVQNYNLKCKMGIKERTYKYALLVIRLIEKLPKDMTSVVIMKQLLRSATSVGANVVEGNSASSRRDFMNFINHALKSANESRFWLNLLKDSGKTASPEAAAAIQETTEICNILAASMLTLKEKRNS